MRNGGHVIGNIAGGAGGVAAVYWMIYLRLKTETDEQQLLDRK